METVVTAGAVVKQKRRRLALAVRGADRAELVERRREADLRAERLEPSVRNRGEVSIAVDAEVPDSVGIGEINLNDLPDNWRQYPAPEELARLGTGWVEGGTTAVLAVPSAVIPSERNYLINPAHRDFGRIRIGVPQLFVFDPRLLLR